MLEKFCIKLVKNKVLFISLVLILAAAFPFIFSSKYVLRIGIISLMYVMLALSLNLMTGMLGQMSFGHAAFWGIGAYTAAILATRAGLPSEITFILSALMAGLFGAILGLPVLKLKGYYFTIVTMVFCEIIRVVEINWMKLTRGPLGIMAIPKPAFFGLKITSQRGFYFLILILVILTAIIIKNIMNSRIGYAVLAIRDDDLAAEAMGVNIFRYKLIIFIVSSMLAGVAGAFFAQYTGFIDPSSFSGVQSNEMLVMVIFGGLGNMFGSFFGAITLSILPELLRGFQQYRQLIYGMLLVLLMLVRPYGLFGSINFKYLAQKMNVSKAQIPVTGGAEHDRYLKSNRINPAFWRIGCFGKHKPSDTEGRDSRNNRAKWRR